MGIVIALPIEAGGLLDRMTDRRRHADVDGRRPAVEEGDLQGRRVALIVAGMGAESARRGTLRLLAGHRPRWILSAGFGGALAPDLARGDALLITEVAEAAPEGYRRLRVDLTPPAPVTAPPGRRFRAGTLLTVGGVVRTAAEKAELRRASGADAVDMESFAVASTCADRGARFLGLRVISDDAAGDLPPEILTIVGPTGGFRLGATLGSLWKRPSSVRDLWRVYEGAQQAADRLAAVVPQVVGQLS